MPPQDIASLVTHFSQSNANRMLPLALSESLSSCLFLCVSVCVSGWAADANVLSAQVELQLPARTRCDTGRDQA